MARKVVAAGVSAPTPPHKIVIADSSPIIGLSLIGGLDWLKPLFGTVHITRTVRDELLTDYQTNPRAGMALITAAIKAGGLKVIAKNYATPTFPHLDEGEASVLAAALNQKLPCLVIIDEMLGRRAAALHDIRCIGLVGIIIIAKKRRLISKIAPALQQLQTHNFRLSDALIAHALFAADER